MVYKIDGRPAIQLDDNVIAYGIHILRKPFIWFDQLIANDH